MALDPSIILQGQGVNALGILDASNQMAAQQKDALHTQGYRNMLATSGAGIMAGDQNALNALAGYDPAAALVIQGQRQDMDYRSQQMAALSAQEKRQAEEYARGLSAEQRAAEAAQIEEAVKMGMLIPDAATWDQQMATMAPELVGQFDNRQALAGKYMSMAEVLKQVSPEQPKLGDRYKVVGGSLYDLGAEGGPAQVGVGAMPEETIFDANGNPIVVRGGPGSNVKFTEGQSKDNVFATRAEGALTALEGPANANDPASPPLVDALADLRSTVAEGIPLVGNYMVGENVPNRQNSGQRIPASHSAQGHGRSYHPG